MSAYAEKSYDDFRVGDHAEVVRAFTQGDPEVEKSLKAMYANFDSIPPEFRLFDRDLLEYMGEAVRIYQEHNR